MGVACVFSREEVMQPVQLNAQSDDIANDASQDGSLNCHGYGSVVSVTATFGQCAAGWVLDKISLGAASKPEN